MKLIKYKSVNRRKVAYLFSLSVSPRVPRLVNAIAVQLQRFEDIALYFRTSPII